MRVFYILDPARPALMLFLYYLFSSLESVALLRVNPEKDSWRATASPSMQVLPWEAQQQMKGCLASRTGRIPPLVLGLPLTRPTCRTRKTTVINFQVLATCSPHTLNL